MLGEIAMYQVHVAVFAVQSTLLYSVWVSDCSAQGNMWVAYSINYIVLIAMYQAYVNMAVVAVQSTLLYSVWVLTALYKLTCAHTVSSYIVLTTMYQVHVNMAVVAVQWTLL